MLVSVISYFIGVSHESQVFISFCIGRKKSKSFLTGLSLYSKVTKKGKTALKLGRDLFEFLNKRCLEQS